MSLNDDSFRDLSGGLWSKSDRKDPNSHHLFFCHLLDAGAVALRMWDESLSERTKTDVAALLAVGLDDAKRLIAYWCALHDIGKASPVFQKRIKQDTRYAIAPGLPMPTRMDEKVYHSEISGWYICAEQLAPQQVAIAISGHHGAWTCDDGIDLRSAGGPEWQAYRNAAARTLRNLVGVSGPVVNALPENGQTNSFTVWLSGFISVVDWLASNEDYFGFVATVDDFGDYFHKSLEIKAGEALHQSGWIGWKARGETASFQQMFQYPPRDIQSRVFEIFDHFHPREPFILVLEAPTGIGKTEIALFLADQWIQKHRGGGLYIAMPSQATSNQIYDRTVKFLQDRYPRDLVPVVLAHGQAKWSERVNNLRIHAIEDEDAKGAVVTDWFLNNRKRSLLTPFGVGTVDQIFLGVLQTRHFFVRLMGLKDKVVVFDEVHAYDTYMQALFHALLPWLRHLGVSVIVLSATLPDAFRREMLASYCGKETAIPENSDYPRVSLAVQAQPAQAHNLAQSITPEQKRPIQIEWIQEKDLVTWLADRLQHGGCAAILCNTVKRAQALYETLEKLVLVPAEDLYLFHARFPYAWRNKIEGEILRKFGKDPQATPGSEDRNPHRPEKAIVIATQVIEQSLDLDFDLMVSEIAPADLILQRAGRLHRHLRTRPPRLSTPTLALIEPEMDDEGFPNFKDSKYIYRHSMLLKSYHYLHAFGRLPVIEKTRELIEQVYSNQSDEDLPPAIQGRVHEYERDELDHEKRTCKNAGQRVIPEPGAENLLYADYLNLSDDDDLKVHQIYRAMTRDTDGLSAEVICLFGKDGSLFLDYGCQEQPVDLDGLSANDPRIADVLGLRVAIRNSGAVNDLFACAAVMRREAIPALRHYPILRFTDGVFASDGYIFRISQKLGLTIEKK